MWPRAFPAKFCVLTAIKIFLRLSAQAGIPPGSLVIPTELGARTVLATRSLGLGEILQTRLGVDKFQIPFWIFGKNLPPAVEIQV